jgi:exopolyphosphatase/guanosine-5'-triphosphate,3'-diphosphate pyrophosphatase
VKYRFRGCSPVRVVGTSGTIRAAHDVLRGLDGSRKGITVARLETLVESLASAGQVRDLKLIGLSAERAPVFPGGIVILLEIMAALGVEHMEISGAALREGILYDMIGRLTDEDARVRTVRAMQARFTVDTQQAARVRSTALMLLARVGKSWDLSHVSDAQMLGWAAELHEIGLDIAHARYHEHGAYLLEHADMPGFPRAEQRVLACLVGAHRRKLGHGPFDGLPRNWFRRVPRLALILRLAVLFHRNRSGLALPEIEFHARGRRLRLALPAAWLEASPLTLADLERECERLAAAGFTLSVQAR